MSSQEGGTLEGSPSATPTTNTVDSSSSRSPLISHKVTKLDTLAGLAVRYNVSVSDIKRVNGLLSDNALYARDVIHIPPVGVVPAAGDELQLIFAQIANGFGRDPVLNADATSHPASSAAARVARALNVMSGQGFPPDEDLSLPWWCRCSPWDEDEMRAAMRSRHGSMSDDEPGEFELQERNADGTAFMGMDGSGPTRMHERMRRRRGHTLDDTDAGDDEADDAARLFGRPPRPPTIPSLLVSGPSPQGEGVSQVLKQLGSGFQGFGKALGNMNIVQKIKAVASQPALAVPSRHSFAEVAEGVLGSISRRSTGSPILSLSGTAPDSVSHRTQMRYSRAGGKDD